MSDVKVPEVATETTPEIKLPIAWRDPITTAVMSVLMLAMGIFVSGTSRLSFEGSTSWFDIPEADVPARPFILILTVIALALTAMVWYLALKRRHINGWYLVIVGTLMVTSFIVWVPAGNASARMPVVSLLAGGLTLATPLVFGALSGAMCERTGVINIAIEGQLLVGAFLGGVTASAFGTPWLGLVGAPIAGALLGALLAWFTITFRSDHIIVGVVLNMLALGLTSFFFSSLLRPNAETLNKALRLPVLPIPILSDIPIIGPILFKQSALVYIMFAAVILLQFLFFHSRWGLRSRACGEHPKAADTVGINVNRMRWMNVILAGAVAGLGGAFFTVGQGLAFNKDMAAGNGFIALAAMIIGRWNPKGGFAAALLFGFTTNLGYIMQAVNTPIPTEFLLMLPYLVTILAVAGFVGAVRAPAMEGKPYPA